MKKKAPAKMQRSAAPAGALPVTRQITDQNNTTIVASGSDGPITIAAYDAPNKTTWFVVRSYQMRDGNGSFLTFQNMDSAGKWYDALGLNGGFIISTAGHVSSCLDILCYSDGKPFNISINGAANGYPAAIAVDPPGVPVEIGSSYNGFAQLWLKEYPRRPGMPVAAKASVKINGKYVPLFD